MTAQSGLDNEFQEQKSFCAALPIGYASLVFPQQAPHILSITKHLAQNSLNVENSLTHLDCTVLLSLFLEEQGGGVVLVEELERVKSY